ncbi:MAG: AI-2E family transporter [Deltaproteobacteria bacterium]|nr:AI-2E family transporter [Deltaproteobacteria bacterium]
MSEAAHEDRAFIARATRIAITVAAVLIALLALLYLLKGALTPLAVALAVAYFLDPIVVRLKGWGVPRSVGILVPMLGIVLLLALFAFVVLPAIMSQLGELAQKLPAYWNAALGWAIPRVESLGIEVPATWAEAFRGALGHFDVSRVGALATGLLGGIAGGLGSVVGLLVIPVITFYMLAEFPAVKSGLLSMVPPRFHDSVQSRWMNVDSLLSGFVRGQVTVCAILAVLYALGFWVLDVPMAMLIGLVSGAIAFIPYIGSATALVLAGLLCLFEHGVGVRLIGVGAWYVVVQNLEGFVLTPRIVGGSVGMHPMTVIVALLIGGNLLGFLGLIVAVPLAAIVQVFVREAVDWYRSSEFYAGAGSGESA